MFFRNCIIACALFFGSLNATCDLLHPLTLPELIDIALENNPNTRQAWWNARRAAAAEGTAKSAYYPHIGLEGHASHGRTFKFINGPDTNYTIVGADLVLTMLLFDCGERSASVESARQSLLAANWQTDWAIQKVMVHVLENAYALAHAQEVLQAAIISLQDAEKVFQTASELNRNGLSPISDVYTTKAAVALLKMETSQQHALVDIQKGKLVASLGLPADTQLELAPFEQLPAPQLQQTTELIELAHRQRADLQAKQARVAESFSNLYKTQASYSPKIYLNGRGGANHAFHHKENGLQYEIMLNIEIPLFNGFERMYQKQMAYADTQISMEEMNELELNISFEVLAYSRSLEAAQQMLPDAEDNLHNAQKAYECDLERYQAGKGGIAEVSNALRQLAAARVRYSDIKTRWLVSLANLAYATGVLAPHMETSCE